MAFLGEYGNDCIFPLPWDFPLALNGDGKSMELQQDGPVLSKSEFQQFRGKASGLTAFAFAIAFIAVAISSSVGSIPRALATGCCGSLFGMSGSSMSDLEFSSERKNLTHLSRYALCRATVSLPRHGSTVIRPSLSPPVALI